MEKNVFLLSEEGNAILKASPRVLCENTALNPPHPPIFSVLLPPEKAEGCENYLHSEDVEQDVLRDATKAAGKKRISLDVRFLTLQ